MAEDEYISLASAMLLNGYPCENPNIFHVISARRRRNLLINGQKVIFLFRKKSIIESVLKYTIVADNVRIATPFLAWLDMLDRLRHAPDHITLAELAQQIPFARNNLLTAARSISDTVLKRACFFMGWCCRLNRARSLADNISSSPAYLDTRVPKEKTVWEKNLKIFFPEGLLTLQVLENPARRFDKLFFRNSPAFTNAARRYSPLILAYDKNSREFAALGFPKEPIAFHCLKNWLADLNFQHINTDLKFSDLKNLSEWLKELVSATEQKKSIYFSVRQAAVELRDDVQICQQLLLLAMAVEYQELAVFLLENFALNIWLYGETNILVLAAAFLRDFGQLSDDSLAVLIISLVGSGKFDQGLKLYAASALKKSVQGLPLFCQAVIAMRIYNDLQADDIYKKAIRRFEQTNHQVLQALAKIYLGNFHLRLRRYAEASSEYESVMSLQGNIHIPAGVMAIMIGNMGVAQFGAGNHQNAIKLLLKAIPQCQKTSYATSFSLFKYYYALNLTMLGRFPEALHEAEETWEIKHKIGNSFLVPEITALPAFVSLIFARDSLATRWQTIIRSSKNLADSEGIFFEIIRLFLAKNFEKTEKLCRINEAIFHDISVISILKLHAMTIVMVLKLKNKSLKRSLLFRTIYLSDNNQSWFHESFYGRMIEVLCSSDMETKSVGIDRLLAESIATGRFDTLWFIFADLITDLQMPTMADYLRRQLRLSPARVRSTAIKYLQNNQAARKMLRAEDFKKAAEYLCVCNSGIRSISYEDYLRHRALSEKNRTFMYDEIQQEIIVSPFRVKVRKTTQPMKLLAFLMQNHTKKTTTALAYESIWQSAFDEETDLDSFNSTAKRLNAFCKRHSLPIRLKISSPAQHRQLSLQLPAKWSAVFAI